MKKTILIFIFSVMLTFVPLSISWIHHQLVTGLNPFLAIVIMPLLFIVAILVFWLLFKLFKRYVSITPAVLFLAAFFSFLVLQIYYGESALNIHLHDTYYVGANIYPMLLAAIGFGSFAAIYYWSQKSFGMQMNNRLGQLHFWISFPCVSCLVSPIYYEGLAGMPRRYYDFDNSSLNVIFARNGYEYTAILLLVIAQLLFVYNFFRSVLKKSILNKNTN